MCLRLDYEIKVPFEKGKARLFKILRFVKDDSHPRLESPVFVATGGIWQLGQEKVSNREKLKLDGSVVAYGIHVFINYEDAKKVKHEFQTAYSFDIDSKDTSDLEYVIVEVECLETDFVAAGRWSDPPFCHQAVFMKVLPLRILSPEPSPAAIEQGENNVDHQTSEKLLS